MDILLGHVAGLSTDKWDCQLMSFWQCYIDDSGSHAQANHFVLAGYIATTSVWLDFTREWTDNLKRCGLDWFHMTDAEARRGECYGKWSNDEREENITSFAQIIKRHNIDAIAATVRRPIWSKYEAVLRPYRELHRDLGSIYGLLVGAVLANVEGVCMERDIPFGNFEPFFSEPNEMNAWTKDFVRESFVKRGFLEPVFRPMRRWAPLQAADMCAWWVRRVKDDPDALVHPRHKGIAEARLQFDINDEVIESWISLVQRELKDVPPRDSSNMK